MSTKTTEVTVAKKPFDEKKKSDTDYYMGRPIKDRYAYDHINILRKWGLNSKQNVSVVKIHVDNLLQTPGVKESKTALDAKKVHVSNEDTFAHVIKNYNYKTDRILVMVFAAGSNRCGGMINGKNAQEEQLCRLTDAPFILEKFGVYERLYHDRDRAMILVRNALFLLDTNFNDLENPVKIDLLFAAAPRLEEEGTEPTQDQDKFMDKLIEATFLTVASGGFTKTPYTKAYLGAFGCGCFHWDADTVSKKFLKYHAKYADSICDVYHVIKDKIGYNYKAFNKTFSKV